MKRILLYVIMLSAFNNLFAAQGDSERGKQLAAKGYCYTCHGDNGVAPSRNTPSLAGQSPEYLVKMLKAYKKGLYLDNKSLGMQAAVAPMSAQNMNDLAAFYAVQPVSSTASLGVPPASAKICIACHATSGEPNIKEAIPGLGGLSAAYIKRQLHAYRSGKRSQPKMVAVVGTLTEAQINEVANFYGSH